jgi:flagellar motor switch protein FliM
LELQSLFGNIANQMRLRLRSAVVAASADIRYAKFGNLIEEFDSQSIVGIFEIEEWNAKGLVLYDLQFAQNSVESILGGRFEAQQQSKFRYSESIKNLLESEMRFVVSVLQEQLSKMNPVKCSFSKVAQGIDSAYIFHKNTWALAAPMSIIVDDKVLGTAYFVLTRDAIEAAMPVIKNEKADYAWRNHVYEQVYQTVATAQVTIHQRYMTLKDVTGLSVGDFIAIDNPYRGALEVNNIQLFPVSVGKSADKAAVTLEQAEPDLAEMARNLL